MPIMTRSDYRSKFSFVRSTLLMVLAHILCIDNSIGFATAFSTSLIFPSQSSRNAFFASTSADLEPSNLDKKEMILVLGGSGYIGRRICKELVDAIDNGDDTRVVSISRNGKPPSWALDSWSEKVEWVQHEIRSNSSVAETLETICGNKSWETTIVGCIGNVNPTTNWVDLWGLAFDNDQLLEENGGIYELFLNQTEALRSAGTLAINRCVLLSLDYTSQKCWEGPLPGYLGGKRLAERRLLEAVAFQRGGKITDPSNLDNVITIGLPNFVYGGKRFPAFGKIYRTFVESPIAKAYVGGNQAIRSLSASNPEDWLEATLFSSPVDVETAGKASAMAARGLITRDLVNDGEPRKQGFFNTSGLPVVYDDILFLDGTHEIEQLVGKFGKGTKSLQNSKASTKAAEEPLWEGALIGKKAYLYPLPIVSVFLFLFWCIVTDQFVETNKVMWKT